MRQILSFCFLVIFIAFSCQKANTPASPGGGSGGGGTNPPPPPPGGTTGGPTITGISPLVAYQGDVITLTGTGFNPDKTKDTVLVGLTQYVNGTAYFSPGRSGDVLLVGNPKTTIISATATEIKFTTDSAMTILGGQTHKFSLQISAGGKSTITGDTVHLKVFPVVRGVDHYDPYPNTCFGYPIFAGDSLTIGGKGLYPPVTVSIDGKVIDNNYFVDLGVNENGDADIVGFINIDFFGSTTPAGNCSTLTQAKEVTVVNADGRIAKFKAPNFYPGPNTQIKEIYMDHASYSQSIANVGLLTLDGYAIRTFTLIVKGVDNADNSTFSENLTGSSGDLTGTFTTSIDLHALPVPKSSLGATYQVQVVNDAGATISSAAFTLYK